MRALLFDTETTDLIHNSLISDKTQPRIIEFYGHVIEDDGTVLDQLEFRCNPGIRIPPKITEITGISNADVNDKPPFRHRVPEIQRLMNWADAVVAHNLAYDYAVVNQEMKRMGSELKWPKIKVCTVQETEWFKGFRLSLSNLHEHLFGEGFENAHRAKNDVDALTRCWLHMRKSGDV